MPEYKTVAEYAKDEFIEKKSRFIGHIAPCSGEEQALAFLADIRTRFRDANHNVFAYSLREGQLQRASDDGEPQGTGGVQLLNVINGTALTDCCVVATRYFGGTLLGIGGLSRAYSHAARLAVDAAQIKIMAQTIDVLLEIDYNMYGRVERFMSCSPALTLAAEFGAAVLLKARLRIEDFAEFEHELAELTAATVVPETLSSGWEDMGAQIPCSK